MNPMLEQQLLPPSEFRDARGAFDVKGLSRALDLDGAALAKALGASRQSVSKYLSAGRHVQLRDDEQRQFLGKLDRMLTLLRALTDPAKSAEEIRAWLQSPNKALGTERPIDLIQRGQIDPIIRKLMDVLTAAQGG